MENKKSPMWILFALGGGCLMLLVCGVGAEALGLISSMSASQPSNSAPQESFDVLPQESSVDGNPAELIGHWRYTEIVNQDLALVTDYNVYFYTDGTFETYEVNESGQHSNYESGTWTATDTTITLNVSGGETGQIGYSFSGGVLVFDGISKYFERVDP